MLLTVFRSRIKPGFEEELEALGTRMYELATNMPGFVSYSEYMAEDGEFVTLVEFESQETLAAWREHPEHRAAQQAAKEKYFSEYRISVCEVARDYGWRELD